MLAKRKTPKIKMSKCLRFIFAGELIEFIASLKAKGNYLFFTNDASKILIMGVYLQN